MNESPEIVVRIEELVKCYAGRDVVSGISFTIRRGEVFGLLGPNGAGKTTTLDCLVGLRAPTSGAVSVLGLDPFIDRFELTSRVAVQPQQASLFETLTVAETLQLFASFYLNPRLPEDVMELLDLRDQSAVRTKHLSGGQSRRLLIGIALIARPEIIVLDEPSAGLDPNARKGLWSVITELSASGTTVIMSTHHMDEATTLCDRVAIMVAGGVVALDAPEELVRQRAADSVVSFSVPRSTNPQALTDMAFGAPVTIVDSGQFSRVHVNTATPDELMRRVTFDLAIRAHDFDIKRGTLEDLFLELSETDAAHLSDVDS